MALNETAKNLEDEVAELRTEVKALKEKIPPKLVQELIEAASSVLTQESEEEDFEECEHCQQEEEQF